MESIKELIRGLRGFHLIDGTMGEHVKPSAFRRSIGTLFAILFGLSMSLFLIVSLFLSGVYSALAQNEKCTTNLWWQQNQTTATKALARLETIETELQEWITNNEDAVTERDIITIPVVVHVVWFFQDNL